MRNSRRQAQCQFVGWRILLLLLLALPAPARTGDVDGAAGAPSDEPGQRLAATVRIGVAVRKRGLTLSPGEFRLFDDSAGREHRLAFQAKTEISAAHEGIRIGKRSFGPRVTLEPLGPEGAPAVDGRAYRGRLELRRDGGAVTAVNELGVDDYVQGILIHETSPDWPPEALKAQAVISRSYALFNRGRHRADGFDLCNGVHCQVYGGKGSERETTNAAVAETRGQAVTYGGKVVSAVFHSCCGGRTENAENVWDGPPVPYLKSVRCDWCRECPRFRWKARVPLADLSRRLTAAGHRVGRVKSLRVLSRSKSGRAHSVRLSGTQGRAVLRGNPFRTLADGRVVRSTFWTAVSVGRDSLRFSGKGWGHGVGLCQWGAKAMADAGRDHREILRFYYRGARLDGAAGLDAVSMR